METLEKVFFSLIISRFLSDFDVTPATARQCIRSWIPSLLGGDSDHSSCFSLQSSEEGTICSVPVLLIVKALLLGPEVSYRLSIVNCREMLSSRGLMCSSSSIKLCPQLSDATGNSFCTGRCPCWCWCFSLWRYGFRKLWIFQEITGALSAFVLIFLQIFFYKNDIDLWLHVFDLPFSPSASGCGSRLSDLTSALTPPGVL